MARSYEFPTLYKLNHRESIQYWNLRVDEDDKNAIAYITTEWGQEGTDNPQSSTQVVKKGKNKGKSNETDAYQQALSEAESKHNKKKQAGYVDSRQDALDKKVDPKHFKGGIKPMNAYSFKDYKAKIKYPAIVQPKLDGSRCIAEVDLERKTANLWSRRSQEFTSVPHLNDELVTICLEYDNHNRWPEWAIHQRNESNRVILLDGELYADILSNDFQELISIVRTEKADVRSKDIEYHVFDIVPNESSAKNITYETRNELINDLFTVVNNVKTKLIKSIIVHSEDEAMDAFRTFVETGYEGAIIRDFGNLYEVDKRSMTMLKIKEFLDMEFKIIGMNEGKGKLEGAAGSFVCITKDGKTFNVKLAAPIDELVKLWKGPKKNWMNKWMTVRFFEWTTDAAGNPGVPRHPVGIMIREYESGN